MGLRIDSWLAVKSDLVIDMGCVVAVEFVQGTVIALDNSFTEKGKANSVDVLLITTVTWLFFPVVLYRTFFDPVLTITFGSLGSSGTPVSSTL